MHSDYLRTKSWWAVARSLSKIDEELAKAVLEKTGVTPENAPPSIEDE
jgi:Arc/MetJ family transcription regulator